MFIKEMEELKKLEEASVPKGVIEKNSKEL
jgi:hypothetical protein